MAIPEWIEITGKLGPLSVAVAVYVSTRSQTRWQNRLSARSAAVEDQKLRLALLERRSEALDAIRAANQEAWTEGDITTEVVAQVQQALKIAELAFDDAVHEEIGEIMLAIAQWQFQERQRHRWEDNPGKVSEAVDTMMELEDQVRHRLGALISTLRQATKVQMVPPINPPISIIDLVTRRWRA